MVVRPGTITDALTAARLHAGQIDEGFLSRLGPRFLCHLYGRIARSPSSFLLMAERGGAPAGFVAGATDVGALYRQFLLRDGVIAVRDERTPAAQGLAPRPRDAQARCPSCRSGLRADSGTASGRSPP